MVTFRLGAASAIFILLFSACVYKFTSKSILIKSPAAIGYLVLPIGTDLVGLEVIISNIFIHVTKESNINNPANNNKLAIIFFNAWVGIFFATNAPSRLPKPTPEAVQIVISHSMRLLE